MTRKRTNPDFLNGVPELLTLHRMAQLGQFLIPFATGVLILRRAVSRRPEQCIAE